MRVLLVNPPYQTLTSNLGVGHQVPLGLLMVGGALLDAGAEVRLLDAEALRLSGSAIVARVRECSPDVVMTGHAGSTPAHPVCVRMLRAIKRACPEVVTVYGGVYPSYHARSVLAEAPAVDVVVRGEGEATAVELARALNERGLDPGKLRQVDGIAFRDGGRAILTPARASIADLDAYRTGWELIDDWDRYRCFGLGRAAIVQYSRGCPHRCSYCGQRGFWVKWRRKSPGVVADEIAMLRREHGVRFVTLADENPTTLQREWRELLESIIGRAADVRFFATIRASDIVRDAGMLHLYREAGLLYVLLGIDATDPVVLEEVRKGSNAGIDAQACRLLREHGIRSIAAHIVGLGHETKADFRNARRTLDAYDADLVNMMYATPHAWTRFAEKAGGQRVLMEDQRRWDYRHQILENPGLKPWRVFAAVKWLELAHHARPRRLLRLVLHRDRFMRRQFRWTALHIGAVWLGEVLEFTLRLRFSRRPRELREWVERADGEYREAARVVQLSVSRTSGLTLEQQPDLVAAGAGREDERRG